jgi:MFS family permease
MGLAFSETFLVISGALSAVGFSLMNANLMGIISLESDPSEQGAVLGVTQSFAAFARVLGPLSGGVLAEFMINLPYYASGIVIFLVFLWGHKQLRHVRKNRK